MKPPYQRLRIIAALLIFSGSVCSAQTITIRLLDGKSGRPIRNQNVTVSWSPNFSADSVVRIGSDGVGHVDVLKDAQQINVFGGPKNGKEPYRIAYIDCREHQGELVPVQAIQHAGFVPVNRCSKKTISAKPGEIVFWAQKLPWWEPDFQ